MTQFEDLGAYLSPTLDLPVGGKVYRVPSPPAKAGLRMQASFAIAAARKAHQEPKARDLASIDLDAPTSLEQDALGPVYDEMLADGVNLETLRHAGMTAYLWHVAGERAARLYWRSPLGEASTPTPDRSTSTSTAEASETPTPGSSSGTTSHPSSSDESSSAPAV